MKTPLVSIITVTYNSESTIRNTIESVINQTYNNIEYLIIDGNSEDQTVNIIKEYKKKFNGNYTWISEEDKGIYDAINKGIKMANGEIIGIINSDDWYSLDTIEEVVDIYNTQEDAIIVSGQKNLYKRNGEFIGTSDNELPMEKYISKQMPLNHPSTFVSSKIYKLVGLYDTNFKICADYDFVFRCFKEDIKFKFTKKILSHMRLGGISDIGNHSFIHVKEKLKIRMKYSNKIYALYRFFYDYIYIFLRITKRKIMKKLLN